MKNQLALESSAQKSQEIQDLQSEKSRLEEFLTARWVHEQFTSAGLHTASRTLR